jgi:sugar phosphate isomerase/epimerase
MAEGMGFDYVELSASEMATMEPWDPTAYAGLRVRALNLFLPSGMSVWTDPPSGFLAQMVCVLPRAEDIGVDVVVVGGGGQRRHDFSEESWRQLSPEFLPCTSAESAFGKLIFGAFLRFYHSEYDQFLEDFLDLSQREIPSREDFHQKIREAVRSWMSPLMAPEGLNRSETNLGTDTGSFAHTLAYYGIPYTADAFHILKEWDFDGREGGLEEPTARFWEEQLPFAPAHVHVANLVGRAAPLSDDQLLPGFFRRLSKLGYQGLVSLEVSTPFSELNGAADRLRALIEANSY